MLPFSTSAITSCEPDGLITTVPLLFLDDCTAPWTAPSITETSIAAPNRSQK